MTTDQSCSGTNRLVPGWRRGLFRTVLLIGIGTVLGVVAPSLWKAFAGFAPGGESVVEAYLVIAQKHHERLLGEDPSRPEPDRFDLNTQMVILRSHIIATKAIERIEAAEDIRSMKTFAEFRDRADVVVERLTVTPVAGVEQRPTLVRLSFRGPAPEESKRILQAVMESYADFLYDAWDHDVWYSAFFDTWNHATITKLITDPGRPPDLVDGRVSRRGAELVALVMREAETRKRIESLERAARSQPRPPEISKEVAEWAARSGFDQLPAEARRGVDPTQVMIRSLRRELNALLFFRGALAEDLKRILPAAGAAVDDDDFRRDVVAFKEFQDSVLGRTGEIDNELKRQNEPTLGRTYEVRVFTPPKEGK